MTQRVKRITELLTQLFQNNINIPAGAAPVVNIAAPQVNIPVELQDAMRMIAMMYQMQNLARQPRTFGRDDSQRIRDEMRRFADPSFSFDDASSMPASTLVTGGFQEQANITQMINPRFLPQVMEFARRNPQITMAELFQRQSGAFMTGAEIVPHALVFQRQQQPQTLGDVSSLPIGNYPESSAIYQIFYQTTDDYVGMEDIQIPSQDRSEIYQNEFRDFITYLNKKYSADDTISNEQLISEIDEYLIRQSGFKKKPAIAEFKQSETIMDSINEIVPQIQVNHYIDSQSYDAIFNASTRSSLSPYTTQNLKQIINLVKNTDRTFQQQRTTNLLKTNGIVTTISNGTKVLVFTTNDKAVLMSNAEFQQSLSTAERMNYERLEINFDI